MAEENKEPATAAFCPNCGKPATRRGKVIDCENCDASFRYTSEGPKVDKVGAIKALEDRVRTLETKLEQKNAPDDPDESAAETETVVDPDEE